MPFYDYLPTRGCCTIRLSTGSFIHCTKDRNFIKALGLIGDYCGRKYYNDFYTSSYKLGVNYVQKSMKERGIPVTKTQIRKVARPFCRRRHAMKVPFKTYQILETVRSLIDCNQLCCLACKEKKHSYCVRISQKDILCTTFLIDELYHRLKYPGTILLPRSYSATLLHTLNNDYYNCQKK